MSEQDGGPAFPMVLEERTDDGIHTTNVRIIRWRPGLSVRDWFAGQALTGWFSVLSPEVIDEYEGEDEAFAQHQRAVARACYGYADAMLKERKQ